MSLKWKKQQTPLRGRLQTKLYDKLDDFNFSIINFQFIGSNIPAAPAYGVYISKQERVSKTAILWNELVFDQKKKLLRQGYVAPWLESSLQI